MDPLSMTASISTVLQITSELIGYLKDAGNATKEQDQAAVEARNLCTLLTFLRCRVEGARFDDPWFTQVRSLGMENGPLDQFKASLETIVGKLSSSRKREQIKSALLWKLTKQDVESILSRIERLKTLINCALTNDLTTLSKAIYDDVVAIKEQNSQLQSRTVAIHDDVIIVKERTEQIQSLADEGQRNRLSQWLRLPDPSTNYHAALQKRHPKTGLWLLNGQDFLDWKSSTSSLMWLHGNAGCGKTVLSAATLQYILEDQQPRSDLMVSYFYFDFNDIEKQSWQKAIRSLLFQLALQDSGIIQHLENLCQKCANGQQQPPETDMHSLFREVVARPRQKFIVFDALDECTDREELLSFLVELMSSKPRDIHILATSRREKDIEEELTPVVDHNLNIQSALVDSDIRLYIRDRMETDKKLKKWPPSVQDEITTALMEKAGGMFRWAYCQLESIRQCVKLSALREALSSLPETLDDTYRRVLQGLKSTGQLQDAIKVLRWLCFSDRPLKLAETVEILAIETGDQGGFFPEERLPDPTDVMVVCSSLISLTTRKEEDDSDSEDDRIQVQLAHLSIKEFLLSDRCPFGVDIRPKTCHFAIAEGCLHYLLYLSQNGPWTEAVVKEYPLALYAAEHWWQHTRNTRGMLNDTLLDLVLCLLTDEDTALLSWLRLYNIDRRRRKIQVRLRSNEIAQSLYYAAYIGVPEIVERIIKRTVNVNAQGGEYGNALQAASFRGHETVVQMLLDAGADVNAQGGRFGNALQAASARGDEKVVQMLLDAGADVNAQEGGYGNALQVASARGDETVVKMLLDAGADVNAQGGHFGNALQAASARGDEKVVQMLLDAGADVNTQGGCYGNALQVASARGHETVVQILLDAGADVNAQGGWHGNALQAASLEGHKTVVKMLTDAGAVN
ncbi:uncharacterized protein Z518_00256 [Rhinocladiella mackenziei CBS 650.93]|uniref:NACHT domain-containing protein n=1 Tax=Rhinocladiella mackenziei CBS 650.93 TaxID=1442369 RepID=A0A0D2G3K6_9EURO|nr:uncharacterized protein Z518_00256 [Rhinocladiella mackenziei CBS 650.93]KIX09177.1 hypothetical protein Z518_00256 [Rhinocladiella mackenziei CBS 650.93]